MQGSTLGIYKSLFFTRGQTLAETYPGEVMFKQQFRTSASASSTVCVHSFPPLYFRKA